MLKKVVLVFVTLILVAAAVYKWMPVGEKVDPLVYFDEFKNNQNNLVYEDKRIPLKEPALAVDNSIYVSYEFVKNYISDTVFYDNKEKILTITNAREVLRMYEGSDKARRNFTEVTVKTSVKQSNGNTYIPAELISERFGLNIVKSKNSRIFVVDNQTKAKQVAEIKRSTSLRTHPKKRTTVVETLKKGEKIMVYKEEDGFWRVRSEHGVVGYIPKGDITDLTKINAIPLEEVAGLPISNPLQDKVKLVWDQIGAKTPGNWRINKYENVQHANVISPTWFEFEDKSGNLTDRGTKEYVLAAKRRNLQVWPLLSHNFSSPEFTKEVLTSTEKRQYIIDQIIKKSEEYGYDGINIDIENIQPEFSDAWVQFMRELYPQAKEMGLVVSVDVYMPSEWSNHYERGKIAKVCDYFIVMAYDQHWSGSENAGSVSEIPWVEAGIQKNLKEVPKEKLVLGIPFYTRIWKESSEGLKAQSYGMRPAEDVVKSWGVTPVLDEVSGQRYAETQIDNVTYKVWLEDSSSIQQRLDLMNKYDLAGYGAWKLGLETPDIWEELKQVR